MINLTQLRELAGGLEGIGDGALQLLLDAELEYVLSEYPDTADTPLRDIVLVDLIKLRVAYSGFASLTTPGYTSQWVDARLTLVDRLASGSAVSSGTETA